jgi:predicted ATPase
MSTEKSPALISHVEIENFKAVEKASIDLAPLTAIVGVNSSGKSTFIQAILLLVQHIKDEFSTDLQYSLNEDLVQLGSFNESVHRTTSNVAESFRISLDTNTQLFRRRNSNGPTREIRWDVELASDDSEYSRFARLKSLRVEGNRVAVFDDDQEDRRFELLIESVVEISDDSYDEIARIPVDGDRSTLRIVNGRRMSAGSASVVRFAMFEPGHLPVQFQKTQLSDLLSRRAGNRFSINQRMGPVFREIQLANNLLKQSLLPDATNRPTEEVQKSKFIADFKQKIEQAISTTCSNNSDWAEISEIDELGAQKKASSRMDEQCSEVVMQLLKAVGRVLSDAEDSFEKLNPTSDEVANWVSEAAKIALHGQDLLLLTSSLVDDDSLSAPGYRMRESLKNAFNQVHYLGPIRDIDREYAGNFMRRSLGLHGEHSATVLQRESREKISNSPIPPGDFNLNHASKFGEILNGWMQYLDLADAVEVEDRGRYKAGIKIVPRRGGGRTVSVNSVGVGVAQVLPIVMQCLLSEPGASITVIEQPELHLHPSIEVKLADFFVACARSGRQIFVETHSEHLINRLRLEIAQDSSGKTRELVSVLFANQDKNTGVTSYEQALINDLGGIEGGWPEDFLDLSTDQSLSLLQVAMRRRQDEFFANSADDDDDDDDDDDF